MAKYDFLISMRHGGSGDQIVAGHLTEKPVEHDRLEKAEAEVGRFHSMIGRGANPYFTIYNRSTSALDTLNRPAGEMRRVITNDIVVPKELAARCFIHIQLVEVTTS